jgi:hypothetical protein
MGILIGRGRFMVLEISHVKNCLKKIHRAYLGNIFEPWEKNSHNWTPINVGEVPMLSLP